MKQTGRVTLLVVTTVVAVGGFATLWMTRPSLDNEMIEVARERQLQPLIEVEEPARVRRTVEEERQRQVEQLYPYIQRKILDDQTIADHLLGQVEAEIDQKVQSAVTSQLQDAIASDIASFRDEVAAQLEELRTWTDDEIQAKLEAYVPQAVDSVIPRIVPVVAAEFEAHKADYIARLASDLGPNMEGVAEDTIEAQREGIITEAVGRALDSIEQDLQSGALQAPTAEPAAKNSVITAPSFEIRENPIVLTPEEYTEQRETIRKEQIKKVLDLLGTSDSN
ncbi:MAG: hypothetical protein SPF89_05290 [Sphaerochaetaceae bacterium]|nr:hypothetical protein [Spirochaetales bacterium]MDY5499500.1 hypothetical protein [Sphaerochaetaceae bacterium]